MDRPLRIAGPLLPTGRKVRRRGPAGRRPLRIAVLVSVGFHLLLAAVLLFFVRAKPVDPAANPPGTVELLMVEKRGSEPSPPAEPARKVAPAPAPATSPAPPPTAAVTAPPAPPVASDPEGEPLPHPATTPPQTETPPQAEAPRPAEAPRQTETRAVSPAPAPAPQPEAPVFNLEGTDSDSNAIVMGNQVIPASPDDRFRNRPPIYPYDAAARGEHGTVVVVIHVSEYGVSSGIDVAVHSGVASLDAAVLDAVRKWHFRPAMKDGRAVPFDMPMRFVFEAE